MSSSTGAEALATYSAASDATVSRFSVDESVITTDQLNAGGLRVWLSGYDPITEDGSDKLRGYLDYADDHAAASRAIWPITQIEGKTLLLSIHDTATRGVVPSALDAGESVEAIFRMHGIAY